MADTITQSLAATSLSVPSHVHETNGSDSEGNGSQSAPFQSILGAYLYKNSTEIDCLVFKPSESPDQPGSYLTATSTAIKRAKKGYELHHKKQAKANKAGEALKDREVSFKQDDATRLEESRKIVLEETEGTSQRIKIHQAIATRDVKVRVFGWVHRLRQQKGLIFLVLRDGTGFLQCVLTGKLVSERDCYQRYLTKKLPF